MERLARYTGYVIELVFIGAVFIVMLPVWLIDNMIFRPAGRRLRIR